MTVGPLPGAKPTLGQSSLSTASGHSATRYTADMTGCSNLMREITSGPVLQDRVELRHLQVPHHQLLKKSLGRRIPLFLQIRLELPFVL